MISIWLFSFVTSPKCIIYQLSEYSQRNHAFLMILQISCLLANTFSLIQLHLSLTGSLDLTIFR